MELLVQVWCMSVRSVQSMRWDIAMKRALLYPVPIPCLLSFFTQCQEHPLLSFRSSQLLNSFLHRSCHLLLLLTVLKEFRFSYGKKKKKSGVSSQGNRSDGFTTYSKGEQRTVIIKSEWEGHFYLFQSVWVKSGALWVTCCTSLGTWVT